MTNKTKFGLVKIVCMDNFIDLLHFVGSSSKCLRKLLKKLKNMSHKIPIKQYFYLSNFGYFFLEIPNLQ